MDYSKLAKVGSLFDQETDILSKKVDNLSNTINTLKRRITTINLYKQIIEYVHSCIFNKVLNRDMSPHIFLSLLSKTYKILWGSLEKAHENIDALFQQCGMKDLVIEKIEYFRFREPKVEVPKDTEYDTVISFNIL